MTESQFIEENKKQWKELEEALKVGSNNPDQLNALFKKVSGDLSYAQTYFPRRSVRWYLNTLVNAVFDELRTKKKFRFFASIIKFYNVVLPHEIIRNKNAFFASLLVFLLAVAVGGYSTFVNDEFPVSILGANYISVTQENINRGDPMGIYKDMDQFSMFASITINNIKVAFLAFVFGFFFTIGSFYLLIKNGVMLGVFQTIFIKEGLAVQSALSIWIHGTIEISSIVVAGAAGIIVGNSLLFPGTYTRMQSLLLGALRGVYIIMSTVPLFIIAGFFEGFLTRKTELPDIVKLMIILLSLLLILYIYVVSPYLYYRSGKYHTKREEDIPFTIDKDKDLTQLSGIQLSFAEYRKYFEKILLYLILPLTLLAIYPLYHQVSILSPDEIYSIFGSKDILNFGQGGWPLLLVMVGAGMYFFAFMYKVQQIDTNISISLILSTILKHFVSFSIASLLMVLPFYFLSTGYFWVSLFVLPISLSILIIEWTSEENADISAISKSFYFNYKHWLNIVGINLIMLVVFSLVYSGIDDIGQFLIADILSWHKLFDNQAYESIFISNLLKFVFMLMIMPLVYLLLSNLIDNIFKRKYSSDLAERIRNFGLQNKTSR